MRNHRRVVSVFVAFTLAAFAMLAEIASASDKVATFENEFLLVTVRSVSQTETGDAITLVLRFENKTINEFWLAFQGDADSVYLFDDKGGIWIPEYRGGLETCKSRCTDVKEASLFARDQHGSVNLRFKPIKKPSGGKVFSLTAKMYCKRYIDGFTPLFIGLDSIRLP